MSLQIAQIKDLLRQAVSKLDEQRGMIETVIAEHNLLKAVIEEKFGKLHGEITPKAAATVKPAVADESLCDFCGKPESEHPVMGKDGGHGFMKKASKKK